jgi:hypothetical protein
MEEEDAIDLYVFFGHTEMYLFKDVVSSPVRYQGFWSINHKFLGQVVSSYIEDSKVKFFRSVENKKSPPHL